MIEPGWAQAGATIGGVLLTQVITLGIVFWKNGKSTKNAIREEMAEMKEICAGARGTFETRLDGHDKDIDEVKKRRCSS